MSDLIERVTMLAKEIEQFPLGNCSPSDDPDKQTIFLNSFRDQTVRFIASAKRIDDDKLQEMINGLDANPEYITEAYELKANLVGVFDYINDKKNAFKLIFKEKPIISNSTSITLSGLLCRNLIEESANNLPSICTGYGLAEGTIDEAFNSKYNYVYSRITHLKPEEIYNLAKRLQGRYSDKELDDILNLLADGDDINVIAEFENIRGFITKEIGKAQFTIWIAVAWFTDTEIAKALYFKSKEGVNVQIIINDDKINSKLSTKLGEHFELHLVSQKDSLKKLMHNKFCVIDLKKVIHGSYNWTYKARSNNESISFIENRLIAEKFASEFMKLKQKLR